MTYRHFRTRTDAQAWLYTQREQGHAGYITTLSKGCYEVRTWR